MGSEFPQPQPWGKPCPQSGRGSRITPKLGSSPNNSATVWTHTTDITNSSTRWLVPHRPIGSYRDSPLKASLEHGRLMWVHDPSSTIIPSSVRGDKFVGVAWRMRNIATQKCAGRKGCINGGQKKGLARHYSDQKLKSSRNTYHNYWKKLSYNYPKGIR